MHAASTASTARAVATSSTAAAEGHCPEARRHRCHRRGKVVTLLVRASRAATHAHAHASSQAATHAHATVTARPTVAEAARAAAVACTISES